MKIVSPFRVVDFFLTHPSNIYLFKFNNRNSRKRYEIYSKLTIKTRTTSPFSSVSVVDFEQVNVGWTCCANVPIYFNICYSILQKKLFNTRKLQKQPPEMFCKKRCSQKFRRFLFLIKWQAIIKLLKLLPAISIKSYHLHFGS